MTLRTNIHEYRLKRHLVVAYPYHVKEGADKRVMREGLVAQGYRTSRTLRGRKVVCLVCVGPKTWVLPFFAGLQPWDDITSEPTSRMKERERERVSNRI